MRRSPVTIGVIAAELALGALVLAPPAAADDDPGAVDPAPTAPPVTEPAPTPTVVVRTGRTGDPNAATPVAELDVPTGDEPADEPPTPTEPEPEPEPTPTDAPTPSSTPPPAAPGVPAAPATPAPAGTPATSAPPAHTVVEGDNLWSISAAHLASVTGRARAVLPVAEIAAYWVRVCEANRATLRAGDLDLIFAGEVVTLPPL